ncbi:MAG: SH3 domain-containing protein [Anaerolinea sp.]|nr:SH3 domain-containing protein [Anaerolinea sp.]
MSKVTVTSATLNIREQPAATSKAVGEYRQGDVVTALARVEGKFLRDGRFHWLLTDKGWIAETYTQPAYSGPTVVFTPAMHAPGSDWMWQNPDLQAMLRQVNLPIKFLSIGFNGDYWAEFNKPEFHLVRIYWPSDKTKWSPQEVWDYVKAGVLRFYSLGARKFELHNEPNLPQEGFGYSWKNGDEFGRWLAAFATITRQNCPDAQLYYPGLSPGVPWTHQFTFTDAAWPHVKGMMDGICQHAYSGVTNNAAAAAAEVVTQVQEFQKRYALERPLVISECSVNRAAPAAYKAQVYRNLEQELAAIPGVEALVYFISHWEAPPAQAAHQEAWLGTELASRYKNLAL